MRKLSVPQRRLLEALRDGRPCYDHCKSMSDHGGLRATMFWAQRNGFVSWKTLKITKAGRKALE